MTDRERAGGLVREHGWNTTCAQILNPGLSLWFPPEGDAVVGYVRRRGVAVVAGAPVCALARGDAVLDAFERAMGRACYFGAEARLTEICRRRGGYAEVVLGAQPFWSPEGWAGAVDGDASLRAQLARARNKGVGVVERTDTRDPALRRVLDEWLASRRLPTLRFLVEPETLGELGDRRLFVAEREGVPVGFCLMAPIPLRRGWLTEMFVRGAGAPNGTVELAVDAAIRACGGEYATMGIVPLARQGGETGGPGWLHPLTLWARAHGRRFYDFDGLEWFKAKFHPEGWEPVRAIANERAFSLRTLLAIGEAFAHGPLLPATARGLAWSLRREAKVLRRYRAR